MHKPPVSRVRRPEHEQKRERAAEEEQVAAAVWFDGYERGFWTGYATGKKERPDG